MSISDSDTVAVLGSGISGLSVAWYLKKRGIKTILFEAGKETGGVIKSERNEFSVFDFGPNTIRDKTGSVCAMIQQLGLEEEVLTISEASKVRYIVRDGDLKSITQNPLSFLFSDALSFKGKKDLISEPFKKALKSDEDESIGSFLERRIGKEAVDYLADPFFSGIYAGDIYSLSKKKLIAKISDAEQEHGSIFRGLLKNRNSKSEWKPKVLSFKKGIQQLTDRLSEELYDQIKFEKIDELEFKESKFRIKTSQKEYTFDKVISCLPTYELSGILHKEHQQLNKTLLGINYPPMLSTQIIFKRADLNLPQRGFGFLVPRKEEFRLLGAIWKSNIFPSQTHTNYIHVNLMTGGAHDIGILKEDIDDVEKSILNEFFQIMNTEAQPVAVATKCWTRSIPQFKVGFEQTEKIFDDFETTYKGFYLGGNYRWGVSVSDCVEGARGLVKSAF